MADVTYIPDQNQANNILPWMLAGQNNGGIFVGYGGSAFWSGDTLQSLFSVICELGCRECNK